ncbi:MAG TPA: MarR family transcriptional regulator [Gallionella sp.]|nr:MarR family transcriptional regulator [Gallionella sp.]
MKPQDEQFAESLHMVAHAWRTELDRRLRPSGFSHSRWLLLLQLSRHDGCTHRELAQHMGIEAATLVRLVDRMEQEGLLQRRGSDTDRRVKHLKLSAAGKKAVEHIRSHAAVLRREILSGSSKQDIGISIEVLSRIRNQLAIVGG